MTMIPGAANNSDKMKKAVKLLSELQELHPEKSKTELLRKIEMQLDLSPLESEFLHEKFK